MKLLAALLFAQGGFAALYLAMPRHQAEALGRRWSGRATALLRGYGWTGLALAWLACAAAQGWARGSVAIFGVLALAALGIVLAGTWRKRWIAWLCLAPPCAAALLAAARIA